MKLLVFLLFVASNVFAVTIDDAPYSFIQIDKSNLTIKQSKNFSNDDFQLTCIGDLIDFSNQPISLFLNKAWNADVYWKKITSKNGRLLVPDFGTFSAVTTDQGIKYWISENQRGWAMLNIESGYFVATMRLIQLQARCLKKHKNWNEAQ